MPIRAVTRSDATAYCTVKGSKITCAPGRTNRRNSDILIGDSRHNASVQQGRIVLAMSGAAADVTTRQAGCRGVSGAVADAA